MWSELGPQNRQAKSLFTTVNKNPSLSLLIKNPIRMPPVEPQWEKEQWMMNTSHLLELVKTFMQYDGKLVLGSSKYDSTKSNPS